MSSTTDVNAGKPHVPPSPDPDRQGDAPPGDPAPLPGQDDDPWLAPLQERKERDALDRLRRAHARP